MENDIDDIENTMMGIVMEFSDLFLAMLILSIVFVLVLFIVNIINFKKNKEEIRTGYFVLLCILIGNYAIAKFYFIDDFEANIKAQQAIMQNDMSYEITDEDYLYLVHLLLINERSLVAKAQVESIGNALKDDSITGYEYLQIPYIDLEISENTLKDIDLKITDKTQAKLILKQMIKTFEVEK
jgi:hypothetical protein